MLNDLRNIELNGFRNPYGDENTPPLVLEIFVTKDTKQEMEKKKGELSSHLFFSLCCPALTPEKEEINQNKSNRSRRSNRSNSNSRERKNGKNGKSGRNGNGGSGRLRPLSRSIGTIFDDSDGEESKDKNDHDNYFNNFNNNTNSKNQNINQNSNQNSGSNRNRNRTENIQHNNIYFDDLNNLSTVSNQDEYSTILMTCIALTSRAEGTFNITRNKVEFSISCGGRNESNSYSFESETRKTEINEVSRHKREFGLSAHLTRYTKNIP